MTPSGDHNTQPSRGRIAAAGLAMTIATTAAALLLAGPARDGWQALASGAPPRPEDVLGTLLAAIGALLSGWLAVAGALHTVGSVPGVVGEACAVLARRLTPGFARRLFSLALGVSLGTVALPAPLAVAIDSGGGRTTASTASTATVQTPSPGFVPSPPATASATEAAVPAPGWTPSQPTRSIGSEGARLLAPTPRPRVAASDGVTVRRGDTLWDIAARHLGPDASTAEIALEWPRWHAANRAVIGDDPDLILPGQHLVAPGAALAETGSEAAR